MKEINTKPIEPNSCVVKCKCGKEVILKRCVWLNEAEDMFKMFTKNIKNGTPVMEQKYKRRRFYLADCSCGRIYFKKLY